MERRKAHWLVLVVVAIIAFIAPLATAQTVANGPYYATPSWDQKLDISVRFIILANWNSEAVLDRETGIVWQRTPAGGNDSWYTAGRNTCSLAKTGGRMGWRLPTVHEFMSIVDATLFGRPDINGAPLPAGHPFLGVADTGFYWTATTDDQQPSNAFAVGWFPPPATPPNMIYVISPWVKSTGRSVWCVRGGLQPAPQ